MTRLAIETWIWYGVTWLVVIARLLSRRLVVGSVKKYQTDDYLMILAMACDAVLIACMNIVSHTSSNLIDPTQAVDLTPDEIDKRRLGSKLILVVEQLQCTVTWLVKCCLLLMYNRLTTNLTYNRAVKAVAVYVIVGFVVMEILYFGVWCRPFNQYWAVPTDNVQCSTATHHLITNATLNISSDIMIIILPMPLFLKSNATAKIKVALCCIYTVGVFTIVSAVLNKYYSFTDPFGADWTVWYIRESSTALIAANLPLTWPLVRQVMHISTSNQSSSYTPRASRGFDHFDFSVPTITTNGNSSLPTLGPSNSEIPLRERVRTDLEGTSGDRARK
ncbi:hypothetical protein NW754_010859 [Fusarium falciforme]|uniref:Rhodopsin domain-containing protein n=1 Tax=Fusarium falciforme TaxID=195108 RepID=A0A9W8R0A1_9HYPO|nr:hypothetical protein NW754_010859 [Fusarium falciforme]KAJ4181157.1 hypothetical protein NW755_011199 [Fusarium falciforme]